MTPQKSPRLALFLLYSSNHIGFLASQIFILRDCIWVPFSLLFRGISNYAPKDEGTKPSTNQLPPSVPGLRRSGAKLPLLYIPWWPRYGQLYFTWCIFRQPEGKNRAMSLVSGSWPLTAGTQTGSRATPCGIWCDCVALREVLRVLSFFPIIIMSPVLYTYI